MKFLNPQLIKNFFFNIMKQFFFAVDVIILVVIPIL